MNYRRYLKLNLVLLLAGCTVQAADSDIQAQPALVINPSTTSIAELQRVIANLLTMEQITLAKDAFTQSSYLTLERKQHLDNNGQLLMGRTLAMPQEVQLLLRGAQCFLQDSQGNQSPPLKQTQCQPKR